MRRALLYAGGWLVAVVIATGVGFAAISLVGDDVGAPGAQVALVAIPEPTTSPTEGGDPEMSTKTPKPRDTDEPNSSGSSSGSRTTSARATSFTDAGTVTGLCRGDAPRMVSWAPKNGWSVVDVDAVGTRRHVAFTDGTSYVTVTLRCVDKVPTFSSMTTDASPSPEPSSTPEPTPSETVSVDPGDGA